MKKSFLTVALSVLASASMADTIQVSTFNYSGAFPVMNPVMMDSIDIEGKKFSNDGLTQTYQTVRGGTRISELPEAQAESLGMLQFFVENRTYATGKAVVKGLDKYSLFVDGKSVSGGKLCLEPATHEIVIKFLQKQGDRDTLKVSVIADKDGTMALREDGKRIYSLDINTQGVGCSGVKVSSGGKYISLATNVIGENGTTTYQYELFDAQSGRRLMTTSQNFNWMPSSDRYYETRKGVNSRTLVAIDPATGKEEVIARNLPDGYFTMSPTEDYAIFSETQRGPKEGDVHQILTPDDRQPGWRDRSYQTKFDFATGMSQRLTYGFRNSWVYDISADGRYLLLSSDTTDLTRRPTSMRNLYRLDVQTMELDTLIANEGFLSDVSFSPDGKQLVITATPEFHGSIGSRVKEGQIPNGYDYHLYIMDIASRDIRPLTADATQCVQSTVWNRYDGKIYARAEDKDCILLFRIDPKSGKMERLDAGEDYISSFAVADNAPVMVYYGQSLLNSHRAYSMNLKNLKRKVLRDYSAERLDGVSIGMGEGYEFTNRNGDLINCFYVLPPEFDASRKYPMIVHYYGGCSPTSRYLVGSYSPELYAAQGYVFLVVNPSGATGFGQEFAARHVNTAGDVVADDIIEAVQTFCKDHPYVNTDRIGCFSASYGGFMTQLLLSKTDMFATGISHAGISDHTSYWGEGYWGYSYSEVSMADSYPWTRKDLYVDRSPLYMADRIHTPILFLHGSADTNVPIGESIQMFTAMKLLGNETAFVVVDGENHGISDYAKRRQWLRTISAWFSKYLKDDSTWWDALYPEKNL